MGRHCKEQSGTGWSVPASARTGPAVEGKVFVGIVFSQLYSNRQKTSRETQTPHHVNSRMKFGTAFRGCAFFYLT